MMATARALGIAGLLAALGAGCGGQRIDPGGGSPTRPAPQISFVTADLSTGARVAMVRIYNGIDDVPTDVLNTVASGIKVATWPGNVDVSTIQVITNVSGGQLPNGAQRSAYAEIEETLDSALDGNAWYAVSLPARPGEYTLPGEDRAFAFSGGTRGVRFSPAHAPVVASVMSCAKDGGVVAVYARYSEPVTRAGGAPVLDYGATPVACDVGGDAPGETQFICPGTMSGQPFSLQIPDGVAAQASGAPMAARTLGSAGMLTATTNDGCTVHTPATVD
jgi:hypothetical protein